MVLRSTALESSVLALNRCYMAIHVISARRAFCLLCKGNAEVVSIEDGLYMAYDFESWRSLCELRRENEPRRDDEDWIQSVSFPIQVPRVVRLLSYDRAPREVVRFSRRNVFLRDENRCQYCRKRFSPKHLSLDHVVPRSHGGPTTWENIVAACVNCNVRKGGRTPQEAGMSLIRSPSKPKHNPLLTHRVSQKKYRCWRTFLR